MKKILFIIGLISCAHLLSGQSIHICEGDSLQNYWVVPEDIDNAMTWEFVMGSGAQFVSPQNLEEVVVNFPLAGSYVLKFSEISQYGCKGSVMIDIVVHSLPTPLFSYSSSCVDQLVQFENNSLIDGDAQSILWEIGSKQDTSYHFSHVFNQEGNHLVKLSIEDQWGCVNSYSQLIDIKPSPEADFYYTPYEISTLNSEVQFINISSGDSPQFFWEFGDEYVSLDSDPIHIYNNAGWHEINLLMEDFYGCQDSIQKSLLVQSELLFYLPDAFSPNSDGLNDVFGPTGYALEKVQSYSFSIFSQWGGLIFHTSEVNQYWDGKLKSGLEAPMDTYIWNIRIEDELGKKTQHNGTVILAK